MGDMTDLHQLYILLHIIYAYRHTGACIENLKEHTLHKYIEIKKKQKQNI